MYSPLNAQLIQANQQELAGRLPMAEHRRVLREDRGMTVRRRRQLKGLAAVAVALGFVAGAADALADTGARYSPSAHYTANARFTHTVGQVGGRRFFRHR